MSTQRAVSSTRPPLSSRRLIATFVLGAVVGAGASVLIDRSRSDAAVRRITAQTKAPSGSLLAFVREQRCATKICQQLYVGQSESDAAPLETLDRQSVSEIAWTPDAKRVGFVVDGRELWIYDAATRKPAGRVGLLTIEAAQLRLARGITFSENSRAVTFDDCPKRQSGCRAGFVGVPQ